MRVINYPEIMELISDIEKVTTSFASNCTSLTSADCIFKTEDKTFILNKFNPFFEGGYLFYHFYYHLNNPLLFLFDLNNLNRKYFQYFFAHIFEVL